MINSVSLSSYLYPYPYPDPGSQLSITSTRPSSPVGSESIWNKSILDTNQPIDTTAKSEWGGQNINIYLPCGFTSEDGRIRAIFELEDGFKIKGWIMDSHKNSPDAVFYPEKNEITSRILAETNINGYMRQFEVEVGFCEIYKKFTKVDFVDENGGIQSIYVEWLKPIDDNDPEKFEAKFVNQNGNVYFGTVSGNIFKPCFRRSEKNGIISLQQTDHYGRILKAGDKKYWDSNGAVLNLQNEVMRVTDLPLEVDLSILSRINDGFFKKPFKITGELGSESNGNYFIRLEDSRSSDSYKIEGTIDLNKDGCFRFKVNLARKECMIGGLLLASERLF